MDVIYSQRKQSIQPNTPARHLNYYPTRPSQSTTTALYPHQHTRAPTHFLSKIQTKLALTSSEKLKLELEHTLVKKLSSLAAISLPSSLDLANAGTPYQPPSTRNIVGELLTRVRETGGKGLLVPLSSVRSTVSPSGWAARGESWGLVNMIC